MPKHSKYGVVPKAKSKNCTSKFNPKPTPGMKAQARKPVGQKTKAQKIK